MVTFISFAICLIVAASVQCWERGWTRDTANLIGATLFLFAFSNAAGFVTCLLAAKALPWVSLVAAVTAVVILVCLPIQRARDK